MRAERRFLKLISRLREVQWRMYAVALLASWASVLGMASMSPVAPPTRIMLCMVFGVFGSFLIFFLAGMEVGAESEQGEEKPGA